jgi:hypothetical protein
MGRDPVALAEQAVFFIPQLAVNPGPVFRLAKDPKLLPAAKHRPIRKQGRHPEHARFPPFLFEISSSRSGLCAD